MRRIGLAAAAWAAMASGHGAGAVEAIDLARCAGVSDALFDELDAASETHLTDDAADAAHIFMAMARQMPKRDNPSVLHAARREARTALAAPGLSADDADLRIQYCSDLRERFERTGRFAEPGRG